MPIPGMPTAESAVDAITSALDTLDFPASPSVVDTGQLLLTFFSALSSRMSAPPTPITMPQPPLPPLPNPALPKVPEVPKLSMPFKLPF